MVSHIGECAHIVLYTIHDTYVLMHVGCPFGHTVSNNSIVSWTRANKLF